MTGWDLGAFLCTQLRSRQNHLGEREERIPTRCNNIDDLLSIPDVDY